jgi:hypothetical protein
MKAAGVQSRYSIATQRLLMRASHQGKAGGSGKRGGSADSFIQHYQPWSKADLEPTSTRRRVSNSAPAFPRARSARSLARLGPLVEPISLSARSMGLTSLGHPWAGPGGPTDPLRHRRLRMNGSGSGPHATHCRHPDPTGSAGRGLAGGSCAPASGTSI